MGRWPTDRAVPWARRRTRPRRSTRPWRSSTAWMVFLAWIGIPENLRRRRSRILRTPARVLALHVQDEVFHLEGKLMRIAVGPSASVRQPLYPTLLVAIEDFVARLARDPKLPAEIRHLLAGEPRTAAFHPSPNTPSTASLPPRKQEEVSPMCPVRCVTYVSGRSQLRYDVLPMSQAAQTHSKIGPEVVNTMVTASPLKRLVFVAGVAGIVLWLCSAASSFNTGAVFDMSGGRARY